MQAAVQAPIQFIRPGASKPAFHSAALTGDTERFFFDVEARTVPITDLREADLRPALDRQGFELRSHTTAAGDLYDDARIEAVYVPEIEQLVAEALGATQVAVFDVTRRSDAPEGADNRDGSRKPAGRAHVDYTQKSGPVRAADVLGPDVVGGVLAEGGRIVQVNVWRPIKGPVRRSPLALADASSVTPRALVATDQVFPDRVGEIYHLAYEPEQRWYYASCMQPDEVLLIKSWDSAIDGRARFTPHAAFSLPEGDPGAPARESIEVRTFAVLPGPRT